MRPLKAEAQDANTLAELGRASAQIVHDLKNQLNGLKLYATFLRKRIEKSERPADELETINKLIAGLERAAQDAALIVRYSRPLELRRRPGTDLAQSLRSALPNANALHLSVAAADSFAGDFDAAALKEAFAAITEGAYQHNAGDAPAREIVLRREAGGDAPQAVIEWRGVQGHNADPFRSFAGSPGLKMALAAKVIQAHGGAVEHEGETLRAYLPLSKT